MWREYLWRLAVNGWGSGLWAALGCWLAAWAAWVALAIIVFRRPGRIWGDPEED